MSTFEQVLASIDLASEHTWNISLDRSAFQILKGKCSRLSAQIAVHHALQNTMTQLLGPDSSTPLPNAQGRLTKFIDTVYRDRDNVNQNNQPRLAQIRKLDCEPFLFVAISYTPLDIFKMHRTEFDCLLENVDEFLKRNCSSRWIFRKEIQMALAATSDQENVGPLRKSMPNQRHRSTRGAAWLGSSRVLSSSSTTWP